MAKPALDFEEMPSNAGGKKVAHGGGKKSRKGKGKKKKGRRKHAAK